VRETDTIHAFLEHHWFTARMQRADVKLGGRQVAVCTQVDEVAIDEPEGGAH